MKRAALYCRVSTEEQARHGYSLGAQLTALRAFAEREGYFIVGEFSDEGISARKPYKKRPALLELLEYVKADEIDTILFIKLDRWFRNVQAYYEVQPILEEHNVAWKATEEDYETETASGRLKVNIMLSVAQDEADRTSERLKFIFADKRARGEVVSGTVPLGTKIENKRIVVDPERAEIVRDIFRMYIDSHSRYDVGRKLQAKHGLRYSESGLKLLLSNRKYIEMGIVDSRTFDRVQEIAQQKSRQRRPKHHQSLFTGLCKCKCCGAKMRIQPHYTKRDLLAYRCQFHMNYGDTVCDNRRIITEEAIEQWLLDNLLKELDAYNLAIEAEEKKITPTVDTAGIKRKMEKLKDLYLNDLIDRDAYERDYTALRLSLIHI